MIIKGRVADAGGGEVRILMDRDTESYPTIGDEFTVEGADMASLASETDRKIAGFVGDDDAVPVEFFAFDVSPFLMDFDGRITCWQARVDAIVTPIGSPAPRPDPIKTGIRV